MIKTLIQAAEALGYRIRWHRDGPKAAWLPRNSTITLPPRQGRCLLCSLAHELGVTVKVLKPGKPSTKGKQHETHDSHSHGISLSSYRLWG